MPRSNATFQIYMIFMGNLGTYVYRLASVRNKGYAEAFVIFAARGLLVSPIRLATVESVGC